MLEAQVNLASLASLANLVSLVNLASLVNLVSLASLVNLVSLDSLVNLDSPPMTQRSRRSATLPSDLKDPLILHFCVFRGSPFPVPSALAPLGVFAPPLATASRLGLCPRAT